MSSEKGKFRGCSAVVLTCFKWRSRCRGWPIQNGTKCGMWAKGAIAMATDLECGGAEGWKLTVWTSTGTSTEQQLEKVSASVNCNSTLSELGIRRVR
jgi:hypothetical protein